jgi:hypothetical protein
VTWVLVLVLAVGTVTLKVIGPLLAGGVQPPPALVRVIDLLTPALLTALIVTSTFSSGRHLEVDGRAVGVAVGLVLLLLRVPLVVCLVAAAGFVAGVRLLG